MSLHLPRYSFSRGLGHRAFAVAPDVPPFVSAIYSQAGAVVGESLEAIVVPPSLVTTFDDLAGAFKMVGDEVVVEAGIYTMFYLEASAQVNDADTEFFVFAYEVGGVGSEVVVTRTGNGFVTVPADVSIPWAARLVAKVRYAEDVPEDIHIECALRRKQGLNSEGVVIYG